METQLIDNSQQQKSEFIQKNDVPEHMDTDNKQAEREVQIDVPSKKKSVAVKRSSMQPSKASKSKLKRDDETESDLLSGVDLLDLDGEIDDRLLDSTEQLKIDDSSSGAPRSYSALAGEGSNSGYEEEAYDGVPYTGFDDHYSEEVQQQQEVSQNEVFENPTLPQKEVTGRTELPPFASFSQMRQYPQCFSVPLQPQRSDIQQDLPVRMTSQVQRSQLQQVPVGMTSQPQRSQHQQVPVRMTSQPQRSDLQEDDVPVRIDFCHTPTRNKCSNAESDETKASQ